MAHTYTRIHKMSTPHYMLALLDNTILKRVVLYVATNLTREHNELIRARVVEKL